MAQQSTSPVPNQEGGRKRRWRYRAFPIIWTVALGMLIIALQVLDLNRGTQFVGTMASCAAIVGGLIIWFTVASPFAWWLRWGAVLGVLALLIASGQAVEVTNDGDMRPVAIRFAWQPAPDQALAIPQGSEAADDWTTTPQDYPRFLGSGHWAEVSGVELDPDWEANPPEQVWRQEIGAGWSSFAVVGDYAVTQEQRGDTELVTCYRLATGELVWSHADRARFDPASMAGGLGGIGPRATPTIVNEKVITQGGTGIVNCLDARSGNVLWSHDTLVEHGADNLTWGKSGSPLIVDDFVVINVGAPASKQRQETYDESLVAYDLESGEVRWASGNRTTAYASPVLAEFDGVQQVLQINEHFVTAHRAADGKVLWEHEWRGSSSGDASCSQPVPLPENRLLLSHGYGVGASLLRVHHNDGRWRSIAMWHPPIKKALETKFSNVVIRNDYAYGLDDVLMQCAELETGKSMWKKRRRRSFGQGQVMLIGDHILVLSETGEVALLDCTPDEYNEVASMQALDEADVTWNNPAFSAPYLLVRNAREAACYRLPLAE